MVGGKLNCGHANRRSRPYCSRRRKMSSSTNIESLPEDLLLQILLELPAEDIYKGPRLVCKKWNKMIRNPKFVDAHLHRSTPGLIVDCYLQSAPALFVAMRRGQIEKSHFNIEFSGTAPSSCNGLIVDYNYIANPATNQHFDLPPVSPQKGLDWYYVIAYAAVSKKYKVVLMYCSKYELPIEVDKCAILTVGVDRSWRHLHMKHLSIEYPLTTEGFVHWPHSEGTHVMTLNVETEIITETLVPQGCESRYNRYLSTGKSLSLFVFCRELSYEVWDMKPAETREWTKVFKIDFEAQTSKFVQFVPRFCLSDLRLVGWLNYPEVLALRSSSSRVCVFYNVRTHEIDHFEVDYVSGYHNFGFHRNSLVWLDGC